MTIVECKSKFDDIVKLEKRIPTVDEFASLMNLSKEIVNKLYLKWNVDKIEIPKEEIPPVKQVEEKEVKNPIKIIKGIAFIIGLCLTLCSVHFTYMFNSMSMIGLWGFVLSFSIVSFMAFAFVLSSYTQSRFVKIVICFLWALSFVYSVFTAVSGQYEDFKKYTVLDTQDTIVKQADVNNTRLNLLNEKRQSLLPYRDMYIEYNADTRLKVQNPSTWKIIQNAIDELNSVETQIFELENVKLDLIDGETTEHETVYKWLSKILKVNGEVIHLLIITFSAIFIDLCSSICFNFVFEKKI